MDRQREGYVDRQIDKDRQIDRHKLTSYEGFLVGAV